LICYIGLCAGVANREKDFAWSENALYREKFNYFPRRNFNYGCRQAGNK
jgi:hypothetical protein